eukprot:8011365-Alexandrium_andersonii.AAC.1
MGAVRTAWQSDPSEHDKFRGAGAEMLHQRLAGRARVKKQSGSQPTISAPSMRPCLSLPAAWCWRTSTSGALGRF